MKSSAGTNRRVNIQVWPATTPSEQNTHRIPKITDQYSGLLDDLTANQRTGLTAMLSTGFYDGWRPSRSELIRYLQDEYGITRNHVGITDRLPEHVDERERHVSESRG